MTLYDAILDYETDEAHKVLRAASERSLLIRISAPVVGYQLVKGYSSRLRTILDAASNLEGSVMLKSDLENLVDKLGEVTINIFGLKKDKTKYSGAIREWIKARVEFYQQLVQQEKETGNYEDAVRLQFGNVDNYSTALQPVITAENNFVEILKESFPAFVAPLLDLSASAAKEVRGRALQDLFSRQAA